MNNAGHSSEPWPEASNGPSDHADSPLSRVLAQPFMLGLFLPIQSGGWTPSTLPRTTDWTFDYNAQLARQAEALGFDLVFGLAQWTPKDGHGGSTRYRETSIDSFMTVSALAAVCHCRDVSLNGVRSLWIWIMQQSRAVRHATGHWSTGTVANCTLDRHRKTLQGA